MERGVSPKISACERIDTGEWLDSTQRLVNSVAKLAKKSANMGKPADHLGRSRRNSVAGALGLTSPPVLLGKSQLLLATCAENLVKPTVDSGK